MQSQNENQKVNHYQFQAIMKDQQKRNLLIELNARLKQHTKQNSALHELQSQLGLPPTPITLNRWEAMIIDRLDIWSDIQKSPAINQAEIANIRADIEQSDKNLRSSQSRVNQLMKKLEALGTAERFKAVDDNGVQIHSRDEYENYKKSVSAVLNEIKSAAKADAYTADNRKLILWNETIQSLDRFDKTGANEIRKEVVEARQIADERRKHLGEVEDDPFNHEVLRGVIPFNIEIM